MEEIVKQVKSDMLHTVMWLAISMGVAIACYKFVLPLISK